MGSREHENAAACPPEGVRIQCPDGRVVACDVLRDPDGDRDGNAMWVAVPRESLPDPSSGLTLLADVLPGKTVLGFALPLPD